MYPYFTKVLLFRIHLIGHDAFNKLLQVAPKRMFGSVAEFIAFIYVANILF